jgi:hypothetical protein
MESMPSREDGIYTQNSSGRHKSLERRGQWRFAVISARSIYSRPIVLSQLFSSISDNGCCTSGGGNIESGTGEDEYFVRMI